MVLDHNLSESRYLIDAYEQARDHWQTFLDQDPLRSEELTHLQTVAGILCDAHSQLAEDHIFWAALADLPRDLEANREDVEEILNDFNRFLLMEELVLQEIMDVGKAKALITDIALAIHTVREWPTGATIENLRTRATNTRDAICAAQQGLRPVAFAGEPGSSMRYRFYSGLRIVGKTLLFTAGGALVVANLTAVAIDPELALGSAATGVDTMLNQLPWISPA